MNTGDFVESCTAIVEHTDGTMELIYWNMSESANAFAEASENNIQHQIN